MIPLELIRVIFQLKVGNNIVTTTYRLLHVHVLSITLPSPITHQVKTDYRDDKMHLKDGKEIYKAHKFFNLLQNSYLTMHAYGYYLPR